MPNPGNRLAAAGIAAEIMDMFGIEAMEITDVSLINKLHKFTQREDDLLQRSFHQSSVFPEKTYIGDDPFVE